MERLRLADLLLREVEFGKEWAELRTTCLRKGVGCSLVLPQGNELEFIARAHNGPSRKGPECTNVVGDCGCSHSEPRTIMKALKYTRFGPYSVKAIMVCTYSPCTNCANVIIDSGIVQGIVWDILTEHDKRGAEYLRDAIDVLTVQDLKDASGIVKELETYATLGSWCKLS